MTISDTPLQFDVIGNYSIDDDDDDIKEEKPSKNEKKHHSRKSSFISSIASVAKNQVHLGLHTEEDEKPIRSLDSLGQSFYVRRRSQDVNVGEQIQLLFRGALNDIKERRVLSNYPADRIMNYFDGVMKVCVCIVLYFSDCLCKPHVLISYSHLASGFVFINFETRIFQITRISIFV